MESVERKDPRGLTKILHEKSRSRLFRYRTTSHIRDLGMHRRLRTRWLVDTFRNINIFPSLPRVQSRGQRRGRAGRSQGRRRRIMQTFKLLYSSFQNLNILFQNLCSCPMISIRIFTIAFSIESSALAAMGACAVAFLCLCVFFFVNGWVEMERWKDENEGSTLPFYVFDN